MCIVNFLFYYFFNASRPPFSHSSHFTPTKLFIHVYYFTSYWQRIFCYQITLRTMK
jgi:hypothetical protein